MNIAKKAVFLGLVLASATFATKYEAESATLTGGSGIVNSASVSGTGYVDMKEGNIAFENVKVELHQG